MVRLAVTIKTFGFMKVAPPADATVVIDARHLADARTDTPAARAVIDKVLDAAYADDNAVIAIGCGFGEERSVAMAEAAGRALGVTPIHTTRYTPKAGAMHDFYTR